MEFKEEKMKHNFPFKKIILILAMCVLCVIALCGCDNDKIVSISLEGKTEIEVGSFDYSDYILNVVYESGKNESVPLSSSMLSSEDSIKFFVEGEQTVLISYGGLTCQFMVDVKSHTFTDLRFDDITTVYTGNAVVAEVFPNYPDGTTVYYPNGNKFVNAGTYEVTAIVSRKNYVTQELRAIVSIEQAEYDMSGVLFVDQTFDYNGREHSLVVSGNLPTGVTVFYENNNTKIDAGSYLITAVFYGDEVNYKPIGNKTATLTINKKKHDTSGLTFNDETIVYDGLEHSLEVKNCPSGVSVSYELSYRVLEEDENGQSSYITKTETENLKVKNVGEYTYRAIFTSDDKNYEDIISIEASLTITPAEYDTSDIHLEGDEVIYDGNSHSLAVKYKGSTRLPDDVYVLLAYYQKNGKYIFISEDGTYSYDDFYSSNNEKSLAQGVTDYGTYTYSVMLWCKDDNYIISESFTAILTINKATYDTTKVSLEKDNFTYDGKSEISVTVKNLPTDVLGNQLGFRLYYFDTQPEYVNDSSSVGSKMDSKNEPVYNNYLIDSQGNPVTSVKDAGTYWVMIEFLNQTNENYNYLQPMVKIFYVNVTDEA